MSEQVVEPRIRGFLCLTSHPEGCAANVRRQIEVARAGGPGSGLGNVLVIGSSTGFGLASLITSVFGYGADAVGVCFEKASDGRRPATAGFYNLAEVHRQAEDAGRRVHTINGDAFSHEIKQQTIAAVKQLGKIDRVVYSLASPKRKDPDSDTVWSSTLKPIGETYTGKTIDLRDEVVTEATIEPASEEDIANTIKVMGGEDWQLWIDALLEADVLAEGCRAVAYSYIGPQVTYPIYRSGTIGKAKEHIEATAKTIDATLRERLGGGAWISVNKALVTQASAAIPVVPLYISLLFKIMKRQGTHEGTIEQMVRLFGDHFGPDATPTVDDEGRIRLDDRELAPEVQAEVDEYWPQVTTENLEQLTDFAGFKRDFRQLFGFEVDGVDYAAPTELERRLD